MMDAMQSPASIAKKDFFFGSPNTNAASVPVHAPVTGRGIATKSVNAHGPYFCTFVSSFLLVLSKSLSRSLSAYSECFRAYFDPFSKKIRRKYTGRMFPRMERNMAFAIGMS